MGNKKAANRLPFARGGGVRVLCTLQHAFIVRQSSSKLGSALTISIMCREPVTMNSIKKQPGGCFFIEWWRCRESNPGP